MGSPDHDRLRAVRTPPSRRMRPPHHDAATDRPRCWHRARPPAPAAGPSALAAYPLHTGIVATTFWVGEIFDPDATDGSQVYSTYDSQWADALRRL